MKSCLVVVLALLVAACAQAGDPASSAVAAASGQSASGQTVRESALHDSALHESGLRESEPGALPAPVRALAAKGVEIAGELQAPAGYRGYVGKYRGQLLPVYLLPDGQHVVVGSLYDAGGRDLTENAMRDAAAGSLGAAQWDKLAKSSWVAEGNPNAKRVVYVFVDTRCPYCHQLWKASQPWLAKGDVQVRNIIAAVISPHSMPEGAAILDAGGPAKAWQDHERHFGSNPQPAADAGSTASRARIQANNALMVELGSNGTPTMIYKDADGKVRMLQGVPDAQTLQAVFGG